MTPAGTSMEHPAVDIYILGAGVKTPDQLTLETLGALRRCNVVYTIYPLTENECLQLGISGAIRSLWHLFEASVIRRDTYKMVAETVLKAASLERPVAFLTPGNPIVSDSVAQELLSAGPERGFRVRLLPAVSSLDTVMAVLGFDVSPGLQIYDSSWFVASNIAPCIHIPCLLLQVTTFGTWFSTMGRRLRAGALIELRDYLLRFYPSDHVIVFVQSGTRFSRKETRRVPLGDLGAVHGVIPGSLYIPRLKEPLPNNDFIARMTDRRLFQMKYEPLNAEFQLESPEANCVNMSPFHLEHGMSGNQS